MVPGTGGIMILSSSYRSTSLVEKNNVDFNAVHLHLSVSIHNVSLNLPAALLFRSSLLLHFFLLFSVFPCSSSLLFHLHFPHSLKTELWAILCWCKFHMSNNQLCKWGTTAGNSRGWIIITEGWQPFQSRLTGETLFSLGDGRVD